MQVHSSSSTTTSTTITTTTSSSSSSSTKHKTIYDAVINLAKQQLRVYTLNFYLNAILAPFFEARKIKREALLLQKFLYRLYLTPNYDEYCALLKDGWTYRHHIAAEMKGSKKKTKKINNRDGDNEEDDDGFEIITDDEDSDEEQQEFNNTNSQQQKTTTTASSSKKESMIETVITKHKIKLTNQYSAGCKQLLEMLTYNDIQYCPGFIHVDLTKQSTG
eukprot:UN04618